MRKAAVFSMVLALCGMCPAGVAFAQSTRGTLEFVARITPTAARPEPVRQFTFYILTKSYTEIVKEVEEKDAIPPREEFIEGLKLSPELRTWLKNHDVMDLTLPDVDKAMTPDDIIHVPEFLLAYQRSNSGGVTSGIPKPKYADADKTENPERYEKQVNEYHTALKKFIQAHPESVSGVEYRTSRRQSSFRPRRIRTSTGEELFLASRRAITGSVRSTWMPPPATCGCAGMCPW